MPFKLTPSLKSYVNDLCDPLKYCQPFKQEHPDWSSRNLGDEPTYALPSEVVRGNSLHRLFKRNDVVAEKDYAELCFTHAYVGFHRGMGISYPLMSFGQTRSPEISIRRRRPDDEFLETINERVLGVAGRMMTDPSFLQDVRELRLLGEKKRPLVTAPYILFPKPSRPENESPLGPVRVSRKDAAFRKKHHYVCCRWELSGLVDWHLPDPVRPSLPHDPFDQLVHGEPKHGVRVVVPSHYPLTGDDNLLKAITAQQHLNCVYDKHFKQYAQMFRIMYVEWTLRSRFNFGAPRGFVKSLEEISA